MCRHYTWRNDASSLVSHRPTCFKLPELRAGFRELYRRELLYPPPFVTGLWYSRVGRLAGWVGGPRQPGARRRHTAPRRAALRAASPRREAQGRALVKMRNPFVLGLGVCLTGRASPLSVWITRGSAWGRSPPAVAAGFGLTGQRGTGHPWRRPLGWSRRELL